MSFPSERKIAVTGASLIACLLVATGQPDKAAYIAIAMLAYLFGEHNGMKASGKTW